MKIFVIIGYKWKFSSLIYFVEFKFLLIGNINVIEGIIKSFFLIYIKNVEVNYI